MYVEINLRWGPKIIVAEYGLDNVVNVNNKNLKAAMVLIDSPEAWGTVELLTTLREFRWLFDSSIIWMNDRKMTFIYVQLAEKRMDR